MKIEWDSCKWEVPDSIQARTAKKLIEGCVDGLSDYFEEVDDLIVSLGGYICECDYWYAEAHPERCKRAKWEPRQEPKPRDPNAPPLTMDEISEVIRDTLDDALPRFYPSLDPIWRVDE